MEYMSIKGSVELKDGFSLGCLTEDVLNRLEDVVFMNDDGIVTSKVKKGRLWILGEGLMQEVEANRLIGIVKQVYGYSDSSCCIDVQRIRWELNIIMGNEYPPPEPNSGEIVLQEAS